MEGNKLGYSAANIYIFISFQKIQGKTYQSAFQTIEAFKNFVDTQKKIEEHNKKFKLGLSNFQQSANKFADLSLDDMKKVSTGFHPPPMQMSQRSMSVVAPNSIPKGPKSFDWRKKNSVTPVKDQGFFCNACWAFSAIAALESFYLIQYGINASFSEQQLIDCNRNKRTGNWGCQGGSQGSAYVYIENNGIQTTESYPYKEDLPHSDIYPCSANSSDNVGVITDYFRIRPGDEETLKDAVAFFGPFSAAFDGSLESFMYYEKGIYEDPLCDKKFVVFKTYIQDGSLKYFLLYLGV